MKKYYKFFIILLLVCFIVPQIAFASWWNPFSWNIWNNIFHRSDTKTQILENRVKELEDKLSDQSTSASTGADDAKEQKNATDKPTTEIAKPVSNATQVITMKLSAYNSFIDSAIKAYQENITNYNQMKNYVKSIGDGLNYEKSLISMIRDSETESYWRGAWQLVIDEAIEKPLSKCNQLEDAFNENIQKVNSNIAILENEKVKNSASASVSTEQYLAYYDTLKSLIVVDAFSEAINKAYPLLEPFNQKTFSDLKDAVGIVWDAETANYQATMKAYGMLSPSQTNSISNYQPPYIAPPIIKMPQTTHCTIGNSGPYQLNVDCYTSNW